MDAQVVEMPSIKKLRQIITMVLFRMGLYELRSINYTKMIMDTLMSMKYATNTRLKRRFVALDLGCGSGFFSRLLESMGFEVVSLDIDCEALKNSMIARGDRPGISLLCADAHSIPLKEGSVDLVIALSIYEHLESVDVALRETARILKNDGILIVQLPNLEYFIEPHTKFPMFLIPGRYKPLVASKIIDYYVNWDLNIKAFIELASREGLILAKTMKYYHKLKTPPWPPSWFLMFVKRESNTLNREDIAYSSHLLRKQ